MEKVSFDNTADSDQCRPRGWHHQLQIAPPPLTPRTLAQQPVIAPTRAANNHGGRRDSELGKGAQLVPFPSLFSKFDNAVQGWRRVAGCRLNPRDMQFNFINKIFWIAQYWQVHSARRETVIYKLNLSRIAAEYQIAHFTALLFVNMVG